MPHAPKRRCHCGAPYPTLGATCSFLCTSLRLIPQVFAILRKFAFLTFPEAALVNQNGGVAESPLGAAAGTWHSGTWPP